MKTKTLFRIGLITGNTLRQTMVSIFSMAIPFIVITNSSKELWGTFVSLLLFSLFAMQIINWGSKEYLLRRFSVSPSTISGDYSRILFTRFYLVLVFVLFGLFVFPPTYGFFILLWLSGRFFYHSVEALILFEKKYNRAIVIELASFALLCLCLYALKSVIDLYLLLALYSLYQFLKGMLYLLLFRSHLSIGNFKVDWKYFGQALPFFLLSIFGFLASKIDVYIIERLGNSIVTSDYQIINSLLVFTMSLAAFIYAPFTKNIYRNTEKIIAKFRRLLLVSGLVIIPVSLGGIYIILEYYLNLRLSVFFYLAAFIYVFPSFIYGIDIVNLFRLNREKTVVRFILSGIVANTFLSCLLLYFNFGMTGALAGSAAAQVLVLILFLAKRTTHFEYDKTPVTI